MRVLHLIDPASAGWPGLHALACLLRADLGISHSTLLIGSSEGERFAADLGVRTLDRIPAPAGRFRLAASPFRRFLNARGEPDVIHAWSHAALSLAAHVMPGAPTIATFAQPMPPIADWDGPLRRLLRRGAGRPRDVRARSATPAPPRTLFVPGPLPIDTSMFDPAWRARRRAEWGVDNQTTLVGLIGEPAPATDARAFGFVVGFLHVAGRRVVGVAHPDAFHAERSLRFIQHLVNPWRIAFDASPPWRLIPALDAALWLGGRVAAPGAEEAPAPRVSPGAESVAWAVAAGLPVVVEDRPDARAALGQLDSAGLIPTRRPLDLAHALMRIVDHHAAGRDERRARAERIISLRSPELWASRVHDAYLRVADPRQDRFDAPTAAAVRSTALAASAPQS